MKTGIVVILPGRYELQEAREAVFGYHSGKGRFVESPVEEQQGSNGVQGSSLILLQQAVDDLRADVVVVLLEQRALQQQVGADQHVVLRVAVSIAKLGR